MKGVAAGSIWKPGIISKEVLSGSPGSKCARNVRSFFFLN